ncbi:uncharacterized protein LOC117106937 [Anneissia japonica]|uniref:uncharacterized protein LOC117106937 n=1 Tax=Anneissia japonica TaxID=1529436 RepID=UPI0014255713|nr:uncharacterized protein LOC117106937 [Anneissia japonica]
MMEQVMEVVTKVTIRLATTRVMKWISTQIPGAMHAELSSTLSKMTKSLSKDNQKQKLVIIPPTQHNLASYSPSEIIDRLKTMMRKLTSNILVTFVEVQEEVNFVKKTLATRQVRN